MCTITQGSNALLISSSNTLCDRPLAANWPICFEAVNVRHCDEERHSFNAQANQYIISPDNVNHLCLTAIWNCDFGIWDELYDYRVPISLTYWNFLYSVIGHDREEKSVIKLLIDVRLSCLFELMHILLRDVLYRLCLLAHLVAWSRRK